jgi:hypothetical protein
MANSGTVTAGSAALASQYNNLRDDVLNVSTGHTHTGASENGAKVAATGVSSGTAALGAVLTADGSGAAAFLASSSGGILKYQEYTSSGSFVVPASASSSAIVVVEVQGAGEGGQGGSRRGSGTAVSSSAGGNGGAYGVTTLGLAALSTAAGTITVTVGAGGAGGAGIAVTGEAERGSPGGMTSLVGTNGTLEYPGAPNFGPSLSYFYGDGARPQGVAYAYPNSGNGTAAGTVQAIGSQGAYHESARGGSGAPFTASNCKAGLDSDLTGAGGGGGGFINSSEVITRAGNGGKRYNILYGHLRNLTSQNSASITFGGGGAGGTADQVGGTGTNFGGGGGGASTTGNGAAGGAGDIGCGGGGGGACRTGFTSGAGGAGGGARVRVWVIG